MSRTVSYRPEVDGLRAIAVLSVLIYHADFQLFGAAVLQGGFLGVDVFFVISGYLITSILLREMAAGTFTYRGFYERRARRILPALFLVMAATFLLSWQYMLPEQLVRLAGSGMASLAFSSNVWFWLEDSYTAGASNLKPLLHTWSLSVEEQFYLFFPPALLWAMKSRKLSVLNLLIAIGLASIALSIYQGENQPDARFYLLPARAWELLGGAVLAKLELDGAKRDYTYLNSIMTSLGILLIAYSVVAIDEKADHPSYLAVAGTMLIIWFASTKDVVTKCLSLRPIVSVGLISYSLYLWHWPLFALANVRAEVPLTNMDRASLIAGSIILAVLTYKFVERPFRKANAGLMPGRSFPISFTAGGLALFVFGAGVVVASGVPQRFGNVEPILAAAKSDLLSQDGTLCANRPVEESCEFLFPGQSAYIINIGDSHAEAISKGLLGLARDNELNYLSMSQSGCPFVVGVTHTKNGRAKRDCDEAIPKLVEKLSEKAPATVVISGRYPLYLSGRLFDNQEGGVEGGDVYTMTPNAESLSTGMAVAELVAKSITDLLDAGHRVVLVYPVPEVGWNVPKRFTNLISRGASGPERQNTSITTSYDLYLERTAGVRAIFDKLSHEKLVKIRPDKLLCSESTRRCSAVEGGRLLYHDDDHLSPLGASMLVGEIKAQLKTSEANRSVAQSQ